MRRKIRGRQPRARAVISVMALFPLAIFCFEAHARCKVDISKYVGWTIVYSGTVTGYVKDDGSNEDSFEGCQYGRVLIIDYNKAVTCQEYNYSYAYRPDIVIISNRTSMKACIDDEIYDVR
jgi:hypothetical protein